jgi:hypothetical protein
LLIRLAQIGSTSDVYSEGVRFQSWPEHRSSRGLSWFSSVTASRCHDLLIPRPLRFISHYQHLTSYSLSKSRDSSVGIATGNGLDNLGVGVRVLIRPRFFSSPCPPDRIWRPPSLLSNGYRWALSPRVKRPEREAEHSNPTSAEVKMWIYTFTPPYVFMA